jgi:hypothetical protein
MPTAGRFPLRPAKPLVFRRPNGKWGYLCHCGPLGRNGLGESEWHNAFSYQHALTRALDHVLFGHRSPEEVAAAEVSELERLFRQPARGEVL